MREDGIALFVGFSELSAQQLAQDAHGLKLAVHVCTDVSAPPQALPPKPSYFAIINLDAKDGLGLRCIERYRVALPQMPIVAITNRTPIVGVVEAMRCGATTVLCRPTHLSQIVAALSIRPAVNERKPMSLDRVIWEYLNQVVLEAGSIAAAARALKLDRTSLKRMLRKIPPLD